MKSLRMMARDRRDTLSVALCTFNGAPFLMEQLASLASQEVLPDELVIGDDASTDATMEIIAAFRVTSPFPVRVMRNERQLGYRANFLNVAQACRGNLIAFCDQDDVWLPGKIRRCKAAFEDPDVLLVTHAFDTVDVNLGSPVRSGPTEDRVFKPGERRTEPNTPGFTQVFRRELLEAWDPQERPLDPTQPTDPMAHDQWVEFIADALGKYYFIGESLALYRQHGSNLYGMYNPRRRAPLAVRLYKNANQEHLAMLSRVAVKKAEIVAAIATEWHRDRKAVLQNIAGAQQYWMRLAQISRMRANIFFGPSRIPRLRAFIHAVASGAYGGPLTIDIRTLLRDFLAGVAFPRDGAAAPRGR